MATLPTSVAAGEAISAAMFNALLAEVRRLGQRLEAVPEGAGWLERGIIEGRTITGSGTPLACLPSEVTYTVRLLGRNITETFGATRLFRRPVLGDTAKIVPAAVGSRVWVGVFPDGGTGAAGGGAWVVQALVDETIGFAECEP